MGDNETVRERQYQANGTDAFLFAIKARPAWAKFGTFCG